MTTETTQTVITPGLPTHGFVIAKMTDGDTYVLAPTEEAAARGHAYLDPPTAVPCPDWCDDREGHPYEMQDEDLSSARHHRKIFRDDSTETDVFVDAATFATWRDDVEHQDDLAITVWLNGNGSCGTSPPNRRRRSAGFSSELASGWRRLRPHSRSLRVPRPRRGRAPLVHPRGQRGAPRHNRIAPASQCQRLGPCEVAAHPAVWSVTGCRGVRSLIHAPVRGTAAPPGSPVPGGAAVSRSHQAPPTEAAHAAHPRAIQSGSESSDRLRCMAGGVTSA